ncbi:MAG: slipin family protein [Oligoflexia bacterium]|nr:slipin family protein [Oligoflexia bacterium]
MFQNIVQIATVSRRQRVAVLRNGRFERLLGPGRHTLWTLSAWLAGDIIELVSIDTWAAPQSLPVDDVLPDDLEEASLQRVARHEIGILLVDGRDSQVLLPGRYRLWQTGQPSEIVIADVLAEPVPLAHDDVLDIGRGSAWTEAIADAHTAVVLLQGDLPMRELAPGRYRAWRTGSWSLRSVSRARTVLDLAAQDVVTADQVPVRVKPSVSIHVTDPVLHLRENEGQSLVYGAVQLALREVIAARSLDQLTQARGELSEALSARARAALPAVGLGLCEVWVKDLILPGEIRELVNRVTLARKEAEALSIKRREEVAATRQQANTAKMLQQNPVLLRLKELEAMGELAGKIDKLIVIGNPELASAVRLKTVLAEVD